MKTIKYITWVVAGFLSCTTLVAQQKHEVSVHLAGGLSTLSYDAKAGDRKNGAGGNFGVGYTYYFTPKLGISTGLDLSLYNAEYKADQINTIITGLMDPHNDEKYDFYSTADNYKEKQRAIYLNIPLMVRYNIDPANRFYVAGGMKIGIPIKGKYKASGATFTNKGYYTDLENWGLSQEFMGFGTFPNRSVNEDLDFNVAFIASIEAGMKWQLNDKCHLYTGAYFDYGLNDIVKDGNNRNFIKHQHTMTGAEFSNHSLLTSSYAENGKLSKFSKKVVPMSLGIKVALVFEVN